MATNANLVAGQFITSINGKRCTAVSKPGGSAAKTSANVNGGNVQATPNAAQAASSTANSDSTTTTFSLVTSTSTSTSSSTSTSILLSSSAQETNVAPAPQVQETTSDSIPATTSALATNLNVLSTPSPQAQAQAQAQTTSGIIQASQADTGVIASLATAAATTETGAAAVAAGSSAGGAAAAAAGAATASPPSITNGNGAAILSTIAAPPGATDDGSSTAAAAAAGGNGDGSNPALSAVTNTPGTNPETTIAVAGGVIGGLAFLSLVAFLVWFWRRRMRKRRRSTLLTPLSTDPATFGGRGGGDGTMRNGEKGEYVINRGSIGPTPKTERIRATFDYNLKRIKGRFGDMMTSHGSNNSVNMDRGNSQFMATNNVRGSRDSNSTSNTESSETAYGGYGPSAKDRVVGWFGRIAGGGAALTSKFRNGGGGADANSQNEKRAVGMQSNNKNGQPDFLTLLGMDERELERAAQNKKNNKKKRASMDRGRYGSGGNNNYLGRLNIDFDDPFSDTNAIAHQSAKPAPLTVSQLNNPFSDSNAVRNNGDYANATLKPNTYVADIRRSRGRNDPMANFRGESVYRDSTQTVNTVDTSSAKRNRFRSDPFDLERPELLQLGRSTPKTATSSNMSTAGSSNAPMFSDWSGSRLSGGVGTGEIRRPRTAHQRGDSFTSKYSSGVSMGDWSDPGPDVGPSAQMWGDSNDNDRRRGGDSPTKGRQRSNSDESNNSVGKAL